MSIIRKEPSAPGDSLQQRQERALAVDDNATGYTAQWVSSIKPPERAHSVEAQTDPVAGDHQPNPPHSAPALSVRSRLSNRSHTRRNRLELELKHLREEQELFKEKREFELEMRRQEIEREKKLAEWEERRKLQQLEALLAEARLEEELEVDQYIDAGSDQGEEVQDEWKEDQIKYRTQLNAAVTYADKRCERPLEENPSHQKNGSTNQQNPERPVVPFTQPQPNIASRDDDFGQRNSGTRASLVDGETKWVTKSQEETDFRLQQAVQRNNIFQPHLAEVGRERQEQRVSDQPQTCRDVAEPSLSQPTAINSVPTLAAKPADYPDCPLAHDKSATNVQQVFQQQQEMLKMVASTIGSSISKGFEMPRRDYLTFDGNPLSYPSFIENFKTNVEDIESNPNARRNFLIQLCTGKAKDAISGTVMLPPEEGYAKARSILREMFGQTHIIAASHIDRVTKGGPIKGFESEKLLQLARDMENCQMNLSSLGFHADINSRGNLSAVVLRLPSYLRSEWAKEAQNSRDQGNEPDFSRLTKFVVKKAKLANTEYGRLISTKPEVVGDRARKSRYGGPSNRASSFAINGSVGQEDLQLTVRPPEKRLPGKLKCYFCEKNGHAIERCFKFQEKSYEDRKAFVSRKGLCNLCLSKGHYASKCKRTQGCFIPECGKRHHPTLHPVEVKVKAAKQDQESQHGEVQEAQTGHCGAAETLKKQVCLRVVPVKVFGRDGGVEKVTYAIRDEGSNTTLVKESLANELKLDGQPIDFKLTTMNGVSQESGKSYSFCVQGLGQKDCLEIPNALSVKDLSVAKSSIPSKDDIAKWRHFEGISVTELESPEVTLLIGADIPEAHWKLEERRGRKKEPYAVRTPLGWSVAGPLGTATNNNVSSFFIREEDEFLGEMVTKMFQTDFSESSYSPDVSMSIDDRKALYKMESSLKVDVDGHYQLDLPFREIPDFPNNRSLAERRLNSLKMRLKKDRELHTKYKAGVDDYVNKGYAVKIKSSESENPVAEEDNGWYLPHHPVIHPQKPSKPRIVFDCAAKYDDVSLNSKLLQGPDMTNTLVGVLIRFRQDPVAFLADIEAMFCQVRVSPEHRKFLKFLWWKDGDYEQPPEEYEMLVHLFGATSSPSCAGFCLRNVAKEFENEFNSETIETVRKNFYVDDCLKSVKEAEAAISLIKELRELLERRSFRLTKFVSNNVEVLSSIPENERAKSIVRLDFDELPVERALGVEWNVKEDSFNFRIAERKKAPTRRGILSDVSSMYDPLGFAAPFILPAKRLLQQLCKEKIGWDEDISPNMLRVWERWLSGLPLLRNVSVPRYFKSWQLGQLKGIQLHHFSDASFDGYGVVSYLRLEDVNGGVHCSLVMAKSRVAPIKPITIPRLELTAATVAAKQHRQISQELESKVDSVTFWTDSTCVLQYINNESNRFKTFVANRIALIHELSSPSCWRYVDSKSNPADYASRGLRPTDKHEIDQWINGPDFLRRKEKDWPPRPEDISVLPDETLEWKKDVNVYETQIQEVKPLDVFIQHYSAWCRLLKASAWLIRFTRHLRAVYPARNRSCQVPTNNERPDEPTGAGVRPLTVSELQNAKKCVLRYIQRECFPDEVASLKSTSSNSPSKVVVKKSSKLAALSPFMGDDGLLRVGGRLERAEISFDAKHPIIIPSKHHVVGILIRHYHEREGHSGTRAVLAAIQQDFWILQGRSRIRYIVDQCMICRKKYSSPCEQIMASLPSPRVTAFERPFASTGVDYFGPFLIKQGRSQVKRYGCIFTCLAMRAIHIEVAHSLDAESFLCAFSRFASRRGNPKAVYSDNGSNFVAGNRILKEEFEKMKCNEAQTKIHHRLRAKEITWYFNPPLASHCGGIWERLIRSIRRVLAVVMNEQPVDDEAFHTFLIEVERILNDRPLVRNTSQAYDLDPLTPSKLLLLHSNSCLPPGVFVDKDRYSRRWRQAQLLANTFWKRWLREYLPTLQRRQKWLKPKRNLALKDLVLLVDKDCPRGKWPMAIVEEVFPDEKGVVRQVTVRTANGRLKRDIRKLCLLEGVEESTNSDS